MDAIEVDATVYNVLASLLRYAKGEGFTYREFVQAMTAIGFVDVGTGMLEGPQWLGGGKFYYLKGSQRVTPRAAVPPNVRLRWRNELRRLFSLTYESVALRV